MHVHMYRNTRDPYGHFLKKIEQPPLCPNCHHDGHPGKERCDVFEGIPKGYCPCGDSQPRRPTAWVTPRS